MSTIDWSDLDNGKSFSADNSGASISNKKSNRGLVGRKLGIQGKRKAVYSDNVNTKKARRRMEFFTPAEQEMERAKAADQANYSYHLRLLKGKASFQASDDKPALIAKLKREWLEKR